MTEAEQERAAVVAWLEQQANRTDLRGRGFWASARAAWYMLVKPAAIYRGAARYFGEHIQRGDHLGGDT